MRFILTQIIYLPINIYVCKVISPWFAGPRKMGMQRKLDTPFVNNYQELTFSEFCFFINPFVVDIAVSRGEWRSSNAGRIKNVPKTRGRKIQDKKIGSKFATFETINIFFDQFVVPKFFLVAIMLSQAIMYLTIAIGLF